VAFDSVPWLVGGGAEHSPDICRVLSYAALGGAEGVIGVADMRVLAQTTPGSTVRITPGAAAITNTSPGVINETYIARNASETNVSIAATASSARYDLVVARIMDPQFPPWSPPVDAVHGPYVEAYVVSGVSSTTTSAADLNLGYPALALARIAVPANTSTITQAMITDLREVARPRSQRFLRTVSLASGQTDSLGTGATDGEVWPDAGAFTLPIPSWATTAYIKAEWFGIKIPNNSNYYGSLWVRVGSASVQSQTTGFNTVTISNDQRVAMGLADDIAIPASMRGTNQVVTLRGRNAGGNNGFIIADEFSSISLDITFAEQANRV
jgi:hypothetical protein